MYDILERVYRQIPACSCPPGCGECCGILFPSMAEIREIKQWCRLHSIQYKGFDIPVGEDCPYLGAGKQCAIYPARPFLCRLMAVSIDLPCPLGVCRTGKMLNHEVSGYLYSQVYLQGKEKQRTEKHRRVLKTVLDRLATNA